MVDQTVKTIKTVKVIQDQTQIEVTNQIIKEIIRIQTFGIYTTQTTVPEIPRITEIEITQTKGRDNTQIIDHETIQTTDQTIIIITINHVKIPRIEILIIQVDKEDILSHP